MKTQIKTSLLALVLLSTLNPQLSTLFAQSTAFTYQGRLNDGGGPANGLYDFRCQLYDAPSPPDALVSSTVTNAAVPVTNGLFVLSLDFGAAVFNGAERWLLITVRTNGALSFTALLPRQRVAPSPYALHAATAGDMQSGASPTFTGTANFAPPSGPPFTVNSANKVNNLNADLLDGLDSTAFVRKSGDTMTGGLTLAAPAGLSFGNAARQMLNLWDVQYAVGVQANTFYARSHNHFAWFKDGVHADATFDPGTGGTVLMTLNSSGRLDVTGASSSVALNAVDTLGAFSFFRGLKATSDSILGTAVFGVSDLGIAVAGTSANGYAGSFAGAVQINYASPFDKPQLAVKDPSDTGFARLRMQTGARPFWDIAMGGDNSMRFFANGNGDVMLLNTNGQLFVNVLTIRGGADVAEPFKMSEKDLPKGAVVVIDEQNPGKLKLSTEPYDRRVAGIISGAGGVNPGLSLSQQGLVEGDQPVALTGRVYVQADASGDAIKPGDLLTTSATPGQAMKATDHTRAQGAILGKAMTGLKAGQGLVLVLVTLQ